MWVLYKVKQVSQLNFSPSSVGFDYTCVWCATDPLLKDCTFISRSHTFLYLFPNIFMSPSETRGTGLCTILTPKIIFWLFSTTSETGKWQVCHILFVLDINVNNYMSKSILQGDHTIACVSNGNIYNLSPGTLIHLLWIRSCRRLASHSLHRHNKAHLVYFVWMMEH
jgi:hypothetical protein